MPSTTFGHKNVLTNGVQYNENKLMLDKFIEVLELDRNQIYQHPNIHYLIHWGKKLPKIARSVA